MDAPPRHLRRSDLVGVALVVAVAWISSYRSYASAIPRGHVTLLSNRIRTFVHATAVVVAGVVRFYALSQTPLVLAVVVHATTLAVITVSRSLKEHRVDHTRNVCWCVVMICGVTTVGVATVTDQQLTPATVRVRVTHIAVVQQLLVWAVAALGGLIAIHESHYAFASESSWTRHLRRLRWEKMPWAVERPRDLRARAFAMLSGLATASALLSEKCIAEILRQVRTSGDSNDASALTAVLPLLVAAWIVTLTLECYWWHHAVLVDPSRAIPLLHPYLCVRTMVGVIQGILFFDEIHPDHALTGAAGLTAMLTALVGIQFHAPIFAPKRDDQSDAEPLLLGAAESLLGHATSPEPSAPPAAHDNHPTTGSYTPPAHFRLL